MSKWWFHEGLSDYQRLVGRRTLRERLESFWQGRRNALLGRCGECGLPKKGRHKFSCSTGTPQ